MGQYFVFVNETKKEYIHPHKLASGLKFWEILASPVATRALVFLLRRSNEGGGGDIGEAHEDNKKLFCGSWAGDKISLVGDYDESDIYAKCMEASELAHHNKWLKDNKREGERLKKKDLFKDITDAMLPEYNKFIDIDEFQVDLKSTGWRDTVKSRRESDVQAMRPDMVISVKKEIS